jgi:segregation and condensation protein A
VVVCFLAVLELVKGAMVELAQDAPFAPLLIQVARAREAEAPAEIGI